MLTDTATITWDRATAGQIKANAAGGGTSTTISDTPPGSPTNGSLWWESDTGTLWISYNDGNTTQWVGVGGAGGSGVVIGGKITVSNSAPSSPAVNDVWIAPNDNRRLPSGAVFASTLTEPLGVDYTTITATTETVLIPTALTPIPASEPRTGKVYELVVGVRPAQRHAANHASRDGDRWCFHRSGAQNYVPNITTGVYISLLSSSGHFPVQARLFYGLVTGHRGGWQRHRGRDRGHADYYCKRRCLG